MLTGLLSFYAASSVLGSARVGSPNEALILEWLAPPSCPDSNQVVNEVRRALGGKLPEDVASVQVSATVSRTKSSWRVRLERHGSEGARVLRGPTCKAVSIAAAAVLALMVDPAAKIDEPQAGPTSPEEELDEPEAEPGVNNKAGYMSGVGYLRRYNAEDSSDDRPSSWYLATWGAVADRVLPGWALGAAITAGWQRGAQHFEVSLAGWPKSSATVADQPYLGGTVRAYGGSIETWRALVDRSVRIGPSLVMDLGWISATGTGINYPATAVDPWLTFKAGARVEVSLVRHLSAALSFSLVAPLVRPKFVLEGVGQVFQPAWLGGQLAGGLVWQF